MARSWAERCASIVVLAGAGVLAPAAAHPPPGPGLFFSHHPHMRAAPVVFVVLDELPLVSLLDRRGTIDEKLFPGFARLARISAWYRNATTPQTFTKEALPALLTGSYPIRRVGETFEYPRNLFSMLGATYEIRAANVPPNLCPPELCDAPIRPPRVQRLRGFGGGEKAALFFSFLSGLERPDRPRLHFLHLVFPHGPWRYLPSGQRYYEVDPMPGEVDRRGRGRSWRGDGWLVAQGYQRHLMQVRLADRLVDALLVRLKRTGLLHDAVVVVTADHGIGWEPGLPKRLPHERTAATLAGVPLFVKAPGQRVGWVARTPVESVDVLPTLADILGVETWPDVDGLSLWAHAPRRARPRAVVDVPIEGFGRQLKRAAREKHELVGRNLWRVAPGESEELVGLTEAELSIAPPGKVTAHASAVETLVRADPEGHEFPAFFEGLLEAAPARRRPRVAIMVDGRIAAVTRSYESSGLKWFGAMLRPGLFGPHEERVELFLVDDVGGRALTELPLE